MPYDGDGCCVPARSLGVLVCLFFALLTAIVSGVIFASAWSDAWVTVVLVFCVRVFSHVVPVGGVGACFPRVLL